MSSLLVASLQALLRVVRRGRNGRHSVGETCLDGESDIVRPALCYIVTKESGIVRHCVFGVYVPTGSCTCALAYCPS